MRYWDGSAWAGPAVAPQRVETGAGYDLIAPVEAAPQPAYTDQAFTQRENLNAPPVSERIRRNRRMDQFLSSGAITIMLVLGLALGFSIQNTITYYSSPTTVDGTVSEVDISRGRRGQRIRIVISTQESGDFHTSGRPRSFTDGIPRLGTRVRVTYAESTGGLQALEGPAGIDHDLRPFGRILWPIVGVGSTLAALFVLWVEHRRHRDRLVALLALLFFIVAPLASLALSTAVDQLLNGL